MKTVGLIGRANVGKSTLFNRLISEDKAVISSIAGTTRDVVTGVVASRKRRFLVMDFGGVAIRPEDTVEHAVNEKIRAAIEEVDVVLFIVDGQIGVTHEDLSIAKLLRKYITKVILVVNKVDNEKQETSLQDVYRLGFDKMFFVSAIHNRNIDELIEHIVEDVETDEEDTAYQNTFRLAIIGRPNAGKSSLFNKLIGEDKNIISETPGTTRDAIDAIVSISGETYSIIDTAGLRRKAKTSLLLDVLSSSKALKTIRKSDAVMYVMDVLDGAVSYDIRLLEYAWRSGKSILLVVNKWDIKELEVDKDTYKKMLVRENSMFKKIPIVCISAKTGDGMRGLAKEIGELKKRSTTQIKTSYLNRELKKTASDLLGGDIKISYITQTGTSPMRITLFMNNPARFNREQSILIENVLRKKVDLLGVPVIIEPRSKSSTAH